MNICIIPARSGSKRIPCKNIKPFLDRPVIDYTIAAVKETGLFERIVVSTDDSRIGGHASNKGCLYHKRSAELCLDHVPMVEVVIDVLRAMGTQDLRYDYLCMAYACSPFIRAETIVEGFKKLKAGYDVVFPIYRGTAVERTLLMKDDRLVSRFPEHDEESSNAWPPTYYHAGQFFWAKPAPLIVYHSFMQANMAGVIVPAAEAIDIDEPEDWKLAELKYRLLQEQRVGK